MQTRLYRFVLHNQQILHSFSPMYRIYYISSDNQHGAVFVYLRVFVGCIRPPSNWKVKATLKITLKYINHLGVPQEVDTPP